MTKAELNGKLYAMRLPPNKVGVLLLHGLTGMPNEMRSIAKALTAMGCEVEVPMLPGHGATHKELLATNRNDWKAATKQALENLGERCDQLYIGGLSMGASLAVLTAIENPKVRGIVAMSPTIKYDSKNSSNPFQVLLPLVDRIKWLGENTYWTEAAPYGIKDERLQKRITKELEAAKRGEKTGFGQFRTYAGSLRQLQLLAAEVKEHGHKLRCPALIMASTEDTLTTVENTRIFYSWLGCRDTRIILLDGCDHVLPVDLKKDEVAYNFAAFIHRHATAP